MVGKASGKSSRTLSFHPPSLSDGDITVCPPDDMLNRGNKLWASSLVGYFLHSSLPFKVVEPITNECGDTWAYQMFFFIVKATIYSNLILLLIGTMSSPLAHGISHQKLLFSKNGKKVLLSQNLIVRSSLYGSNSVTSLSLISLTKESVILLAQLGNPFSLMR